MRDKNKDPEVRAQKNARSRVRVRERWRQDPEFKERQKAATRAWRSTQHGLKKEKEARMRQKYGVSLEDKEKLFSIQKGLCAICSTKLDLSSAQIDHDHEKKGRDSVRGLLCGRCNKGLGMFDDSPDVLRQAVRYLEVKKLTFDELLARSSLGTPEVREARAQAPKEVVKKILDRVDALDKKRRS